MSVPATGTAPQAVVETPVEAVYDEDAAQFANDNTVYALIIGNNDYQSPLYNPLLGAVADADAIRNVLKDLVKLEDSRTINLRNANRQQMLDGFDELEKVTKDTNDPCIVIFYAGHGAQAARPEGWEVYTTDDEKIEMLCPTDIGMVGEDGNVVEGIPDRTVGVFLSDLAAKRGNNITLILDCCHSASANRDEDNDRIERWLADPPPITAAANVIPDPPNQDLLDGKGTRSIRVATGLGGKYASSHVLLAACGRNKKAFEDREKGHGYFTSALLDFLKGKKVETETYLSLMHSLVMPDWQTPHCMGVNADRPLFNRRGSRSDPSYMPCKVIEARKAAEAEERPATYTLLAGLAEGVFRGEEFYLYKTVPFEGQKDAGAPFGSMVAVHVDATSTVLQRLKGRKTPTRVPKVFYAKRKLGPDYPVSIYCEDQALLQTLSEVKQIGPVTRRRMIHFVDDATKASLILKVQGDDVFVERGDSLLENLLPAGRRFPRPVSRKVPEQIQDIIQGWRHFNYHLERQGRPEHNFQQIRMEMKYLNPADGDWHSDHPDYVPVGENLLTSEPAHVSVSDEQTKKPLGLTLYNDGDVNVYPYLFYFDPTELTITPWPLVAEGAGDGRVDSPLPTKSQLTVGYGNGGADPLKFYFEEDTTKDIGYFKLFITRSPASFRSLNQEVSPFPRIHRDGEDDYIEEGGPKVDTAEQIAENEKLEQRLDREVWGVKLHTVIQEKKPEEGV